MNVVMLSPGYPGEMPRFTRALADAGARVLGVGDQPPDELSESVRDSLAEYVHVASLWNEDDVADAIRQRFKDYPIDRIECLWEPGILLAARLRASFDAQGLSVEQATRFRDKEQMKKALDRAGIRTPRHVQAATSAACWEAAHEIGFPVVIKPIAGAGSADTYRVDDVDGLRDVIPRLRHIPLVSVEEFIDGEEYTFDTITVGGKIAYYNIAWYRPRPLIARTNEWISPQVIALKQVDQQALQGGVQMGYDVVRALEFETGFTHMEWYRKKDGEVVFGEIAARPPGAYQVDQMQYACDFDVFGEWGRAIHRGGWSGKIERRYNVATIYKRAQGTGTIRSIEGLERIERDFGEHIVQNTLLPVGSPRRDWRQTLVSDGFIMLRHRELSTTLAMADTVASELHLFAG